MTQAPAISRASASVIADSGPQPRTRPASTVSRPDLRAVALTLLLAIVAPAVQSAPLSTANADVSSGSGLDRDDVAASIARIEGVAETEPLIDDDPADPRNRRISLLLLEGRGVGAGPVNRPAPAAKPDQKPLPNP